MMFLKIHKVKQFFKDNLAQIAAVSEKEIKLMTRFKVPVILSFILPFINLIMPLIIMGQIFAFRENFGAWTPENFFVFQVIAYQLTLIFGIRNRFSSQFVTELFWHTLQALIIAPFNRINLLFGVVIMHLLMMAVPFTIFLILGVIIVPISFYTFLFLIATYLLILLIFSGLGIFIGALSISKPNYLNIINFFLGFAFLFSCLSYPFELFPQFIKT